MLNSVRFIPGYMGAERTKSYADSCVGLHTPAGQDGRPEAAAWRIPGGQLYEL